MGFENLSGRTFGQYELRELMGVGGMGAVYRAYQSGLDREVAVKVLPRALAAESGYIERFIREARTAAVLEHPHIVRIYDYGTQGDISYLVMALLRGGSLSQRLTQREETNRARASLGEVAALLNQMASALDYAHHEGVLHRDIKPANIMFDNQGRAYLTDFGIAKLMGATTALTGTGVAMGSPSYMPPEQWAGQEVGPPADQYALGVTIYQTIAGRLPFEADSAAQLMYKHFHEEPTPLTATRTDIPPSLMLVLGRAMAKAPESRFPNATQFAQAFEAAIEGSQGDATGFFQYKVRSDRPRPTGATPYSGEMPGASSGPAPVPSGGYAPGQPTVPPTGGGYVPGQPTMPPHGGTPSGGYPPGSYPPGQTPSGMYAGQSPSGAYPIPYTQQTQRPWYRSPVALIGGLVALVGLAAVAVLALRPNENNAADAVFQTLTAVQAVVLTGQQETLVAAAAATETPEAAPTETTEATATDAPTDEPTAAATATSTEAPTDEPTTAPTEAAAAITSTPEPSPTATETEAPTATFTPSETLTDAPTETPTERPTNTATPTPSTTPSPTPTNTIEASPTASFTPRPSSTPTDLPTATREPLFGGALWLNQSVSEVINDDTPVVRYELQGAAGEIVSILATVASGNLDPSLRLYAPSGEEVAWNDDVSNTDRNAALMAIQLPETGAYIVQVERYRAARGNTSGTFDLIVVGGDADEAVEIEFGTTETGTIDDDTPVVEYAFDASPGTVISVMLNVTGGNLDPVVELHAPDGTLYAQNDDAAPGSKDSALDGITLPVEGTYRVVATRYRREAGNSFGEYELTLMEGSLSDARCGVAVTLTAGCPAHVSPDVDRPVNVRTDPRASGAIVAALDAGTPVTVINGPIAAEGFRWYLVRLEDGTEGYMVQRIGFSDVLLPGMP